MATIKFMTYNVYRGGEERFGRICDVVRAERPDVLAVQEACDWKQNGRFEALADELGVPAAGRFLFTANPRSSSGRVYDIALYARYPLAIVQVWNNPKQVWHVLPQVAMRISGARITVLPAHFSPRSEDWRMKEVSTLVRVATSSVGEPAVLLGDLNSLSPLDPYPATLATDLRRAGITKFGGPPRFDVVSTLTAAGWHDTLPPFTHPGASLQSTVHEGGEDRDHLDLRLDYVFVSPSLARKVQSSYVVDTQTSRQASDHLPVVAVLEL